MTQRKTRDTNAASAAKAKTRPAATYGLPEQDLQMIRLNKLELSPKNVRKTPAMEAEDAELYASIKETGLKQNLLVHKVGPKFHVHAGGRRLAALNKLAADKIIKPDHPISCSVEDIDQAEDTSTAENMVRTAMHAADQFAAFATLRAKGRTEDQIASQFGITTDLVRRRLKLASVAPKLMDHFRAGEMSLDCIMAFTLTDDHARQIETWEAVKQHYSPSPHSIRNLLTQKSYSGSSKLAKFVSIKAYRAAGGSVIEDLFAERDAMHLGDPDLLEKLERKNWRVWLLRPEKLGNGRRHTWRPIMTAFVPTAGSIPNRSIPIQNLQPSSPNCRSARIPWKAIMMRRRGQRKFRKKRGRSGTASAKSRTSRRPMSPTQAMTTRSPDVS